MDVHILTEQASLGVAALRFVGQRLRSDPATCWRVFHTCSSAHIPTHVSRSTLQILFDIGGVVGGVVAGHLSDKTGASALVSVGFTLACIPVLYLYRTFGHLSLALNICLMTISGAFYTVLLF